MTWFKMLQNGITCFKIKMVQNDNENSFEYSTKIFWFKTRLITIRAQGAAQLFHFWYCSCCCCYWCYYYGWYCCRCSFNVTVMFSCGQIMFVYETCRQPNQWVSVGMLVSKVIAMSTTTTAEIYADLIAWAGLIYVKGLYFPAMKLNIV